MPLGFLSISCDLSDAAAIEKAFGLIDNCFDGLDNPVNNAGICLVSDAPDIPTIVICSAPGHWTCPEGWTMAGWNFREAGPSQL